MARTDTPPIPGPESAPAAPTGLSAPAAADDGFVPQPVAKTHEKGPFLKGVSDIATTRRITEADFSSVGIKQTTLEFDWKNGYKIPLSKVSKEAVEFLTENEYGFSVVDE